MNVFGYCTGVCRSATEVFVIVKLVAARVVWRRDPEKAPLPLKQEVSSGPANIKTTSQLFLSALFTEEG